MGDWFGILLIILLVFIAGFALGYRFGRSDNGEVGR